LEEKLWTGVIKLFFVFDFANMRQVLDSQADLKIFDKEKCNSLLCQIINYNEDYFVKTD
jgi:hypothetical protein